MTTAHAIVVSAVLLTPDPPSWRTSMVQVDSDRDSSVATTSIVADPVDLPAVMQARQGVEQGLDEQYATCPRTSPSPDDVGTTPDLPCKLVSKRKSANCVRSCGARRGSHHGGSLLSTSPYCMRGR